MPLNPTTKAEGVYKLRYFVHSDIELSSPVTIDKLTRKECAAVRTSLVNRGALNIQVFKRGVLVQKATVSA